METMAKIAFAVYTLLILGGALTAIRARSLVRALMGLIGSLFGVAGMYMLLNTPFLAFMQILIYVGAVVVLIFFAIMLTHADERGEEGRPTETRQNFWALTALIAATAVIGWMLLRAHVPGLPVPAQVAVDELGRGLMEDYFLAFELISVVLLVAMSGAVLLAFEKRGKK